jgi:hypothetical protein
MTNKELITKQGFGVEVEFVGITRVNAAQVVADFFGTSAHRMTGYLDERGIIDGEGRTWKIESDSSLSNLRNDPTNCELVTPPLQYKDIETLQQIVRNLKAAGARANDLCGIHVHVDYSTYHTPQTVKNLVNIMYSKEDLLEKSLKIKRNRISYCKKTELTFVKKLGEKKAVTDDELADLWYEGNEYNRTDHYNHSRYRMLNLHNIWQRSGSKRTIEFRMYNGTLHAGKIKAYINLSLAMSAQAINQKRAKAQKPITDNDKYAFRCWLLTLGMIGDEFKTTRDHLLANLTGNAAWRHDPNTYASYQNRNKKKDEITTAAAVTINNNTIGVA